MMPFWAERVFLTEFDQVSQKLATVCLDRHTGSILYVAIVAYPVSIEDDR